MYIYIYIYIYLMRCARKTATVPNLRQGGHYQLQLDLDLEPQLELDPENWKTWIAQSLHRKTDCVCHAST